MMHARSTADRTRPVVTTRVERRLRRSWHNLRRRLAMDGIVTTRLAIRKAAWLNDARSPVMLMVDDLTNAWHAPAGGDRWHPGGDWGGAHDDPGSALRYFEDGFLRDFPEARVTFFTVAGPISAYTRHQPFSSAAPLDNDPASRAFFRSLAEDPRFELAYHGYDHGTSGARTEEFVQEFAGFPSVDAAIARTKAGLEIFRRAIGAPPRGGKYGGWAYNAFADSVIDDCGFLWWCRDWMPRDITGRIADEYYDTQFFGRNLVVALPATVHGQFWDRRQIDRLLSRRQVIAIEEHIAPVRPDGFVQTPNIIDDMGELRALYGYLREHTVWHATGTEIATYVIARERSLLYDISRDGFSIRYDGRVDRPQLTLIIDGTALCSPATPVVEITTPDGQILDGSAGRFDLESHRHCVTVPVMDGRYRVRPIPRGEV